LFNFFAIWCFSPPNPNNKLMSKKCLCILVHNKLLIGYT
jgi:hypothetical protein